MKKPKALGVCDLLYFTTAITVVNEVTKNSFANFSHMENTLGGKMVTVFFEGDIADIKETIQIIDNLCQNNFPGHLKNVVIIPNPHEEILKFI